MGRNSSQCILEIPFTDLGASPVSLTQATECRFQFIDCHRFIHKETIRILEFAQLPTDPSYAVVSYVWKGLQPLSDDTPSIPNIIIDGAVGADPISGEVLRLVIIAASMSGCELIWLDGLCILQGNETDKTWQIERMYSIYTSSKDCIVVPGGLRRLTTLEEETSWILRAWTLQEAVAPTSSHCLFSWKYPSCTLQTNIPLTITAIEPGMAAITDLLSLLQMVSKRTNDYHILDSAFKEIVFPAPYPYINIFGNSLQAQPQVTELLQAMQKKGKPEMSIAIWRSSFLRSAKYPVDTVFSIMGLLGVTLDVKRFGPDDRLGATIALMQAILQAGGRAEWLGIGIDTEPNPRLSTIPSFPHTNSAGKAIIAIKDDGDKEVSRLISTSWGIRETPKGTMDDQGYFRFRAPAASIRKARSSTNMAGFSSKTLGKWELLPNTQGSFAAVFIGYWADYSNVALGLAFRSDNCVLMLIKKHAPGKYHNIGYVFVEEHVLGRKGWKKNVFVVGGPEA
ncbi:hypothetical protein PT974_02421 [Cladobotryum mycophilum]|uniref:Heterokaryon incompatibility domain-containing protein n=1 Tax=Cladobotryum mycophilum TaxID=491253 RepID=A0ABR0SYI9_9HYPO